MTAIADEALRVVNICNACRYCEGSCAVFPAISRQLSFAQTDIERLAHLCHQCGACYEHCQYAPPHEFAVNVPKVLAELREESYAEQLRPAWLRQLFSQGSRLAIVTVLVFSAVFLLGIVWTGGISALFAPQNDFYQLIPHSVMAGSFSIAALFVIAVWWLTSQQLFAYLGQRREKNITAQVLLQAIIAAATLKNLHGGHDEGCYETGEQPTPWKRHFHHLVMLGFVLCFLATVSGTAYHYLLNQPAPYGFFTLPKLLGMPGGILLAIGCLGLLAVRKETTREIKPDDNGSGVSLTVMLLLTALTGLALPIMSSGKGLMLGIHLGVVLALFVNFACGKFLHAIFRFISLLLDEAEKANRP